MQLSVKDIFSNFKLVSLLMLTLTLFLLIVLASEHLSFSKLEIFDKQKELIQNIYSADLTDIKLAKIETRGNIKRLKNTMNRLEDLYNYDYLAQALKIHAHHQQMGELQNKINVYTQSALENLTLESPDNQRLTLSYHELINQISSIQALNRNYEYPRFLIEVALTALLFLVLLIASFSFAHRSKQILDDFNRLTTLSEEDEVHTLLSHEAQLIASHLLRPVSKSSSSKPIINNIDPLTAINNYHGAVTEFNDKKSKKIGNYTAVCIFSIDKLGAVEAKISQDFADTIVEKTAFMLSLYQQPNDVIGRIDHNQFIFILSRHDKASAVEDCEQIRKSINESKFTTDDKRNLVVTLSGGFVQKMSTQNLEEVIIKAKKVLSLSLQHGGNRIAQLRDNNMAIK